MASYITRIATVEIPVTNIEDSVKWYARTFHLYIQHQTRQDAMLSFNARGVPTIFLVKRADNTNPVKTVTEYNKSLIDFYTYDLEGFYAYLKEGRAEVGSLHLENGFGRFDFRDPDGNPLGVTNITHLGQE